MYTCFCFIFEGKFNLKEEREREKKKGIKEFLDHTKNKRIKKGPSKWWW